MFENYSNDSRYKIDFNGIEPVIDQKFESVILNYVSSAYAILKCQQKEKLSSAEIAQEFLKEAACKIFINFSKNKNIMILGYDLVYKFYYHKKL